ncbi:hypothetical protein E2C01_066200 [Portunus trituberculatus]|uniref:Uncharacterized protein n=1 Tax=Portunus trituberculatus TaxID=210409 RepID=A0A5B7HT75_PORTR|nr:hypothetical protein [Portunus trituberculatus]
MEISMFTTSLVFSPPSLTILVN